MCLPPRPARRGGWRVADPPNSPQHLTWADAATVLPKSPDAVVWPNPRDRFELDDAMLDFAIEGGYMLCGNPEEVCEQVQAYQDVGCDQLVFGTPDEGYTHDQVIEMIECFGTGVIPEFDKDPVHRTTRMREAAVPQFPEFNGDVDPIVATAVPPEFPVSV